MVRPPGALLLCDLCRHGLNFAQPSIRKTEPFQVGHDLRRFIRAEQLHVPIGKIPLFEFMSPKGPDIFVPVIIGYALEKIRGCRGRSFDCLHEIPAIKEQYASDTKRRVPRLTLGDNRGNLVDRIGQDPLAAIRYGQKIRHPEYVCAPVGLFVPLLTQNLSDMFQVLRIRTRKSRTDHSARLGSRMSWQPGWCVRALGASRIP